MGDDDTTRRRDPPHGERSVDQHLGLPAGERDPQQLDRPPPLDTDQDSDVRQHRPRGAVAAAVLLRVEQRLQSAVRGDPAGHGRAGDVVEPVGPEVGDGGDDERAVRRVGRARAPPDRRGHPAQPGAVGGDLVDVDDEVPVGPRVPRGDEGEGRAVRAPDDVGAVGVPGGQLHRCGRRGVVAQRGGQVEDEDLAAAVGQEADAVRAVRQRGDQPRRLGLGADALDRAVPAVLGHPGDVGEPP
ncbi:hypothetical protein [Blastococcus sp. TML/C7B]|uniref:hypothetical protein n=1 Tax=Blastococcus sp. TML/C7B TaxID=2798728 RepID=UPI001F5B535C|nr:hypothetical protein [Blastococcus sp. TML/C7B]